MLDKITVTILIGNSDNKLTQKDWSYFVSEIRSLVWIFEVATHFVGSTEPFSEYQSGCFVFEMPKANLQELKQRLTYVKQRHNQSSIALLVGNTEFV